MPEQIVPASTKVHYKRVRNLDSDRLHRRRAWLIENKARIARECDGRPRMRQTARELLAIEAELIERDELTRAESHWG